MSIPSLIDLSALRAWMDAQALGRGALENVHQLAGGTQNILVRFTRDGVDYVLRRPPEHLRENSNEAMRREARILGALAGTGVPHPRLIAACGDVSVLGVAFYLMQMVAGFNPIRGLPSPHAQSAPMQQRMGLALVEGIAALGALDHQALGLADFGRPDGFLQRQVARWRAQLDSYAAMPGWPGASALPGVNKVAAWLDAHCPVTFKPGILHGDYHLANVMYRHDSAELAAIVDWELATIGDPLIDLGWLLATWPDPAFGDVSSVKPWLGFPAADALIAHYRAHSTRDLSAIQWYGVLACYKLGILLEGTHARACAGKAPPETGARLHENAVRLFRRALRWLD